MRLTCDMLYCNASGRLSETTSWLNNHTPSWETTSRLTSQLWRATLDGVLLLKQNGLANLLARTLIGMRQGLIAARND